MPKFLGNTGLDTLIRKVDGTYARKTQLDTLEENFNKKIEEMNVDGAVASKKDLDDLADKVQKEVLTSLQSVTEVVTGYKDAGVLDTLKDVIDVLNGGDAAAQFIANSEGLIAEVEDLRGQIGTWDNTNSEGSGILKELAVLKGDVAKKASQQDVNALKDTVGDKANQSDLDDLEGRVEANETNIKTLIGLMGDFEGGTINELLASKADATVVTGIDSRVSALETSIVDKASKEDLTTLTNTVNDLTDLVEGLDTEQLGGTANSYISGIRQENGKLIATVDTFDEWNNENVTELFESVINKSDTTTPNS